MADHKILIVLFDSLRPDLVSAGQMPALSEFVGQGSHWPHSSCVFPSATRVNSAALGSGSYPGTHGLVVNKLFDHAVFPDRILHTGLWAEVERAERVYGGRFISAPSLGEQLAAHHKRMAVISSGSAGTTHMVNPRAAELNQVSLCLRDWPSGTPADLAAKLLQRFGPIPEAGFPAKERMIWQTDLFIDGVYPAYEPDVTLLWYTEPDWSNHKFGLGSPEVKGAQEVLDEQFKRLLDWAASSAPGAPVQVIALSDHGCISSTSKVDLPGELAWAGISIYPGGGDNAPWMASLGNISALWRRDPKDRKSSLVPHLGWLRAQPWCEFIFGGPGQDWSGHEVLDLGMVQARHARSPELLFTLATGNEPGGGGFAGSGLHCNQVGPGGTIHSGLQRREMNNLLAMGGPGVKQGRAFDLPAGIVDLAPTVLACLGVEPHPGMTGRVLQEALRAGGEPDLEPVFDQLEMPGGAGRQKIHLARMGSTPYILGTENDLGI